MKDIYKNLSKIGGIGMEIKQALLTKNPYSRPGVKLSKVTKIVVHWVGNANSTAQANRNYFESLKTKKIYASSHYIIGLEGEILLCVPEDEVAYHATVANGYSIGIENCHPNWDGKFNDKTYKSLIELCSDLCKRYNLNPEKDIIRHYDVTKKECPKYYVKNTKAWLKLKEDVKNKMQEKKVDNELIEAVQDIIDYGIQIDINVWGNVETMNMKYAKLFVEKIGKGLGKENYEETIQYLVKQGCINTPIVWIEGKIKPEYCRTLLIRISQLIKNKK